MEGREFNLETEANKFSGLEGRVDEVSQKGAELHSDMKGVSKVSNEVKAEGVLTEEEQDTSTEYSQAEKDAMGIDIKRSQLEELKAVNAEKSPTRALERKRNRAEGDATRLDLRIVDERAKSEKRLAKLEAERDQLIAEFNKKNDKLQKKADKDMDKLKRKIKKNIRSIAAELRRNPAVEDVRDLKDFAEAHNETFGIDGRLKEQSEKIRETRDEAVRDESVIDAKDRIAESKIDLDEKDDRGKVGQRRARLLRDQMTLKEEYQDKLASLQAKYKEEAKASSDKITNLEGERDSKVDIVMQLEEEIAVIERDKEILDDLKAEIREFDFSGAEKIMEDVEERAANSVSLEALEESKEGLSSQLDKVLDSLKTLGEALGLGAKEAEDAIAAAYEAQSEVLAAEKEAEENEKRSSHEEYVDELKAPFREVIAGVRQKEEGVDDFDLFGAALDKAKGFNKAVKSIDKSEKKLAKSLSKIEEIFAKLNGKLDAAAGEAYGKLDARTGSIETRIDLAQTMAETAKEENFPDESGFFKKVFSKIFKN